MMDRRQIMLGMVGAMLAPGAGLAQEGGSIESVLVKQLRAQGFVEIQVETTWLGRLRILATRADGQREIIANPITGEILRDLWNSSAAQARTVILDDVGGGSGSGTSGSGSSGGGTSGGGTSGGSGSGGSGSGGSGSGGSGGGGSGSGGSGGSGGGSGSSGGGDGGSDDHSDDDSGSDDSGSDDSGDDDGEDK